MANDMTRSTAKGGALRRPWICAWIVTLAMGGTTMAFQVYHSITRGHMPAPLAVLYGIVPLLIAVLVLEIVAEWADGPFAAKGAAYVIMGAAMYLSASATGAVVLHAAPPHFSLLFGALLDAAELLAAYFIMNGPRAADAAAGTAASAAAEREARLRVELDAVSGLRRTAEAALEAARTETETARSEAAAAVAKTEALARKLADDTRPRPPVTGGSRPRTQPGNDTRKPAPVTGPDDTEAEPVITGDVDAEALVLKYLSEGCSASEAGRKAGLTDSRGRQIARKLAAAAPSGMGDGGTPGGEQGSGER